MRREYIVNILNSEIIQMKHDDFESFCESEDLPIFVEKGRFTWFDGLVIMEIK